MIRLLLNYHEKTSKFHVIFNVFFLDNINILPKQQANEMMTGALRSVGAGLTHKQTAAASRDLNRSSQEPH